MPHVGPQVGQGQRMRLGYGSVVILCSSAAIGGHLGIIKCLSWANCSKSTRGTCPCAAQGGLRPPGGPHLAEVIGAPAASGIDEETHKQSEI